MDDFTITTIYFDGQFWCAFIQKKIDGEFYSGRYVFGAEPTNPQLIQWMLSKISIEIKNGKKGNDKYGTIQTQKQRIVESKTSRTQGSGTAVRRLFIQLHIFISYIFGCGYVQILSALRFYAIIMRSVFLRRGV